MTEPLDQREQERQAVQQNLDRRYTTAERNRLGQFTTPTALALDMACLAQQYLPETGSVNFLDPGVGSGVFFYAACKTLGVARLRSALGFEVDAAVAAEAGRLWNPFGLQVRTEDFATATPPAAEADRAALILCNPPYVRHHHLPATQKAKLRQRLAQANLPVSGLTGLYGYFLLLAHAWLAERGVGVWIVPAEFLDVNYGKTLKEYLVTRVTLHRVHRFDPEDVQFADALVSSVVAVFTKAPPPTGHQVRLTSGSRILAPLVTHAIPLAELCPASKWGPRFSRPGAGMVDGGALTVGDLFAVRRGLATGSNEFFILERHKARSLGLPDAFLRPILPNPRHIAGSHINCTQDGFPEGLPALVLLDCDLTPEEIHRQHPALAEYLRQGEQQGINRRYLPAHRSLWYRQEQRPPAPLLCTYMGRQNGGRAIRFLRNRSDATAPNVYLLLYPRPALAAEAQQHPDILDQLFDALNEVAADLLNGGRVYGGGLNKIEPKELEGIVLPGWVQKGYGRLREVRQRHLDRFTPDSL